MTLLHRATANNDTTCIEWAVLNGALTSSVHVRQEKKTNKVQSTSCSHFVKNALTAVLSLSLMFSRRRQPAIDRFTWRRDPTSLRRRVSTAVSWALYIYNKKFSLSNYSLLYCRTVSLLVRRGADLSATNAAGESAIVVARKCGSTRCVSILEVRNAA